MIWRKFTVTSRNLLRDPIARLLFQAQLHLLHPWSRALRGTRNPHVPACTLRSLRRTWMCKCRVRQDAGSDRSVRIALGPLATVSRGFLALMVLVLASPAWAASTAERKRAGLNARH